MNPAAAATDFTAKEEVYDDDDDAGVPFAVCPEIRLVQGTTKQKENHRSTTCGPAAATSE